MWSAAMPPAVDQVKPIYVSDIPGKEPRRGLDAPLYRGSTRTPIGNVITLL